MAEDPSGRLLASASYDNSVRLWDLETGALVSTLLDHESSVNSVYFSTDGKQLVSAGRDGRIVIREVRIRELLDLVTGDFSRAGLSKSGSIVFGLNPDGTKPAYYGKIDLHQLGNTHTQSPDTGLVHVNVDHERGLLFELRLNGDATTWNNDSGTVFKQHTLNFPLKAFIRDLKPRTDEVMSIASNNRLQLALGLADGRIKILDAVTGNQLGEFAAGFVEQMD